ncbi:ribonuclease H-like domain-containing protein [Tanacetum coccineum]
MILRAVLMKSGLVSVNTARQVNATYSKTTVNAARPKSHFSKTTHLIIKRPIHNNTSYKNSNFNQRVNTVKDKNVNAARPKAVVNAARPKAVVNAIQGNNVNAVKASACWGKPQMDLQDKGVIDSGCSRHMTGNMSYLTNYKEIDGGYVAFGGNPKGGEITGKRFTWVFFLATKDETSGILKSFITGIENLVDHKVKVIRCDNENEFKNREMNQFCEKKGILRQYSAEAVNTVCYVQNRVLVVKPHNKTPYELFHGRTPTLRFMRPFGCPVTIINTIDHLGKFDGKADKGSGPDWLFDIDALTRIMNYKPIVAGTQSNVFVCTKANDNAGQARKETKPVKNYILLPLWHVDPLFSQDPKSSQDDGSKSDDEKKVDEYPRKDSESIDQEKDANVNSTNNVNAASINES